MYRFLFAISAILLTSPAQSQEPQASLSTYEFYPDHILRRVADDPLPGLESQVQRPGDALSGYISASRRWNTSEPIKVCFFGGSQPLRARIVDVAGKWEASVPAIKFDFGDRSNPRLCDGRFAQIRIGFSQKGYWSMVGQDSVSHARQDEESMNLGMFDIRPPSDAEMTRVVLHEFGHALGFQHEHQNPRGGCDGEYNWPHVYSYLTGPPNYWSQQTIDWNLKSRRYVDGDALTAFDNKSIMLYSFPTAFYRKGDQSVCYAAQNYDISIGDRQIANNVYSVAASNALAEFTQRVQSAATQLSAPDQSRVRYNLALYQANASAQARILGIVDENYVDVDVFSCNATAASKTLRDEIAQEIRAEPALGRLRVRGDQNLSTASRSKITIFADQKHPEYADAVRLAEALTTKYGRIVEIAPNTGSPSRWYLSVITCQ